MCGGTHSFNTTAEILHNMISYIFCGHSLEIISEESQLCCTKIRTAVNLVNSGRFSDKNFVESSKLDSKANLTLNQVTEIRAKALVI